VVSSVSSERRDPRAPPPPALRHGVDVDSTPLARAHGLSSPGQLGSFRGGMSHIAPAYLPWGPGMHDLKHTSLRCSAKRGKQMINGCPA
jgi:hypothetical protein